MRANNRGAPRRPMRYPVKIQVAEEPRPERCELMEISLTGARLRVENSETLPPEFTMVLSDRGVPRRDCSVVWRSPEEIGVRFVKPQPTEQPAEADLSASGICP